jgi:hypothetical protein
MNFHFIAERLHLSSRLSNGQSFGQANNLGPLCQEAVAASNQSCQSRGNMAPDAARQETPGTYLENDAIDHMGILDSQVQGDSPGGGDAKASQPLLGYAPNKVAVICDQDRDKHSNACRKEARRASSDAHNGAAVGAYRRDSQRVERGKKNRNVCLLMD